MDAICDSSDLDLNALVKHCYNELIKTSDTYDLDSRILIAHVLKIRDIDFIINKDMFVEKSLANEVYNLVDRRKKGEPIAYIINNKEFMGLEFYVDSNVLIPRPDTEILCERFISKVGVEHVNALEIGVGSGAISISSLVNCPNLRVAGVDISEKALAISERNAGAHGVKERFDLFLSDVYNVKKPFSSSVNGLNKFDIIVSNPPYIRSADVPDLMLDVADYEPHLALDGGVDGLDFYRRIIEDAHKFLSSNGYVMFEIGFDQGCELEKILRKNNFEDIKIIKDYASNDRVVEARIRKC